MRREILQYFPELLPYFAALYDDAATLVHEGNTRLHWPQAWVVKWLGLRGTWSLRRSASRLTGVLLLSRRSLLSVLSVTPCRRNASLTDEYLKKLQLVAEAAQARSAPFLSDTLKCFICSGGCGQFAWKPN
jgi:hypothetical protein